MCNSLILFNKSYKAFLKKHWGGNPDLSYTHKKKHFEFILLD